MTDESRDKERRPGRKRQGKVAAAVDVKRAEGNQPRENPSDGAAAEVVRIPVVGIGASAGGIEALSSLFEAMPVDTGCAFVVVLHLDPTRESEMAHILSTHTSMPVFQVKDGMRLAPDHVYVIAPDNDLRVRDGGLRMSKPAEPRGQRHPVDVLFRSIAADQRERGMAIVLSGTGSNGTEGLKEIRAQGGMSLVQSPETAKFDGMPRSAISADLADHVLAPENMPEALTRYVRHGYVSAGADVAMPSPESDFRELLEFLRFKTGSDFRTYKRSTLGRRIHRRLGLRNIESVQDYLEELRANSDEVTALVKDLMISVTSFFRDPDAWQALSELVIAPLIAEREDGDAVRVWVPACSTGEEAYSIAMQITEKADAVGKRFDVKVFATDAQEANLRKAREGSYPEAALADLPPSRVRRFFEKADGFCRVNKGLRDIVVFAPQNLLRDPPFSRLDLVCCRNFLIYIEPEAQRRVIALCHFALQPGGHLFLGNAETLGRHDDLFETVSKKWRIYRRVGPTRHDLVEYPPARGAAESSDTAGTSPPAGDANASVGEAARRALLDNYAPASVLVDHRDRVLYFHGPTGHYLEQPTGEPSRDLLAMARQGLAMKLRAAVREAARNSKRITASARLTGGDAARPVEITVLPLPGVSGGRNMFLVSFVPGAPATSARTPEPKEGEAPAGERALQDELRLIRSELQNTIENLETANEELKAANEEGTSMNEELQSTNEELETSKEELQSFNEELHTVNNQLQHKIGELESVTNDLTNLLAGTETATLFLDNALCIRWYAPATTELFNFVPSDIGRPISHFARKFVDEKLLSDAEKVANTLVRIEAEVRGDTGRWYLRRMLPYRTRDNRIAGIVITFIDITDQKTAADDINEARVYAEAIVKTIRQPLLVLDGDLRVQSANLAFHELFKIPASGIQNRLVYEIGNGDLDIPLLRSLLDDVLSQEKEFNDFEIEHEFRDIGKRCILLNARKLLRNGGREDLILLAMEDFTGRKRAAVRQQVLIGELNHRVKNVMATVQAVASQTLGTASSMEEARSVFGSRLIALAKAHDVLTSGNWEGAELGAIVRDTVDPHDTGLERFTIEGPYVHLVPSAALALAMAIHELCTNAAKYGALSVADGHVKIAWKLEGGAQDRRLHLRWTESGGPEVAVPTQKGFGSRLIERALALELAGHVNVAYESLGVVCSIDAPMPDNREHKPYGDERAAAETNPDR